MAGINIASGIKAAHDGFFNSGLMTYWTLGEFANTVKAGVDVAGTGMNGAWDNDEGYGREMGEAAGSAIGGAFMLAANIDLQMHSYKIHGGANIFTGRGGPDSVSEARILNSNIYHKLENGSFREAGSISTGKFEPFVGKALDMGPNTDIGKALKANGKDGFIKTMGKEAEFIEGQGQLRGLAPFAIALGVQFAARGILGFAGGLLDEANKDYHRERNVHYDSRFFNTDREMQSNMQTLGMAMNNYENRFQSTARIYHSR